MRAQRVRFTKLSPPQRSKRRDGVEVCLNSPYGRQEMRERLWYRLREQQRLCVACHEPIERIEDARFKARQFKEDEDNPVVHKKCFREGN